VRQTDSRGSRSRVAVYLHTIIRSHYARGTRRAYLYSDMDMEPSSASYNYYVSIWDFDFFINLTRTNQNAFRTIKVGP
jgi:hypothetical protein